MESFFEREVKRLDFVSERNRMREIEKKALDEKKASAHDDEGEVSSFNTIIQYVFRVQNNNLKLVRQDDQSIVVFCSYQKPNSWSCRKSCTYTCTYYFYYVRLLWPFSAFTCCFFQSLL